MTKRAAQAPATDIIDPKLFVAQARARAQAVLDTYEIHGTGLENSAAIDTFDEHAVDDVLTLCEPIDAARSRISNLS